MKDVQRDIANRDAVTAPDQSPFTREAVAPLSSALVREQQGGAGTLSQLAASG